MRIRKGRRRPLKAVTDNRARKQRQARQARQKAKAHAQQRIVSGRGTAMVDQEIRAALPVRIQGPNRNTGLGHSAAKATPSRSMMRTGLGRVLATIVLPGSIFAEMGRPAPSLVCYVLQASLVGWLPAVVWAFSARRRVAQKQSQLAARLR